MRQKPDRVLRDFLRKNELLNELIPLFVEELFSLILKVDVGLKRFRESDHQSSILRTTRRYTNTVWEIVYQKLCCGH